MKRIFMVLVVASIALVAFVPDLSAQITQVVSQTQISAEARPQHTVEPFMQLNFGRFYPGVAGGTIEITPGNERFTTGDIVTFNAFGWSPASFQLQGYDNQTFTYTLPTQVVLNNGMPGGTLQVGTFTPDLPSNSTLGPTGMATLNIGATLTVPPGATHGYYSGVLGITVDFQ